MILERICQLVWPPACLVCGRYGPDHFCAACRGRIESLDRPLDLPVRPEVPVFSWGRHSGVLREAIEHFKYGRKKVLGRELGGILADRFSFLAGQGDILVPVPLAAGRRRSRGFNQAEILACGLALVWRKKVLADVLIRRRATPPLYKLSPADRHKALAGAFALTQVPDLRGTARIILVDDIITTGATLAACARVWRGRSPAPIVAAVTLARA